MRDAAGRAVSAGKGSGNPDSYWSRPGRPGEILVSDGGEFIWWSRGREPVATPVEPTLPPPRAAMARVSSPVDANGSPVREEAS
jgi:hypothetical protein